MRKAFLLLIAFVSCLVVIAQTEEVTTKSGKKVILYADGTWKYADAVSNKPTELAKEKEKKPAVQTTAITTIDCDGLLESTDDPRTGMRITRTSNRMIAESNGSKTQIGISVQKNSKGILTLYLYPMGAGACISEGAKINIEFADGSKTELAHDTFENCLGEVSTSFLGNFGKKKQLELLKTKKIKKLKVWTQEGMVQQELSVEIQNNILKAFNCLGG